MVGQVREVEPKDGLEVLDGPIGHPHPGIHDAQVAKGIGVHPLGGQRKGGPAVLDARPALPFLL